LVDKIFEIMLLFPGLAQAVVAQRVVQRTRQVREQSLRQEQRPPRHQHGETVLNVRRQNVEIENVESLRV
jgi:hypothetical protein